MDTLYTENTIRPSYWNFLQRGEVIANERFIFASIGRQNDKGNERRPTEEDKHEICLQTVWHV